MALLAIVKESSQQYVNSLWAAMYMASNEGTATEMLLYVHSCSNSLLFSQTNLCSACVCVCVCVCVDGFLLRRIMYVYTQPTGFDRVGYSVGLGLHHRDLVRATLYYNVLFGGRGTP